jgi:hypothetical protein
LDEYQRLAPLVRVPSLFVHSVSVDVACHQFGLSFCLIQCHFGQKSVRDVASQ